jgi:hypothetical protein
MVEFRTDIIHRTNTNYHFEDNDQDLPVCIVVFVLDGGDRPLFTFLFYFVIYVSLFIYIVLYLIFLFRG